MIVKLAQGIIGLSKLRIVSLLVFVAACGMFKAYGGVPPISLLLVVLFSGALAAAGSNAINQGLDADIDAAMRRTRRRPVPSKLVGRHTAIILGTFSVIVAVVTMGIFANWLSALLTLTAALVYVFMYTMVMKRRSWNNIVIGGAAGALPPLIGAAAVTGQIEAVGVYMFGLVFFWTPPHFWALSLIIKDDYAVAKVPMLPIVGGNRATAVQIVLYIALLVSLGWLPLFAGYSGILYTTVTVLFGFEWLRRSLPLLGNEPRGAALASYKFSILWLYSIFLALLIETLLHW